MLFTALHQTATTTTTKIYVDIRLWNQLHVVSKNKKEPAIYRRNSNEMEWNVGDLLFFIHTTTTTTKRDDFSANGNFLHCYRSAVTLVIVYQYCCYQTKMTKKFNVGLLH